MNRKIIVNHKEFKMEKMSADTYMEYLELAEQIDAATSERASKRYSRQEIEAMMLFICKAYGNQFTVDELKDAESGLDAAGIVIEFNMIDMGIAEEMNKRMDKNGSDKITDALFFNKRIIQEIFGNRMSLDELGEVDVIEFLTASKGIHFIMQDIVSDALLNIVETEPIERETSAFDEYDRENGYEDEEQEEQNTWKICGEIVDRVTKIAIRLMRESYGQCMKENIIELLKYLKFELETVNENT